MTVYYDRQPATTVATVDELDALLDQVVATPKYHEFPVLVSVESADRRYVLQVVLGRADLSTLIWHEAEIDILASKGTVGYSKRPRFNYGGTATDAYDHSAIPVDVARRAVKEFFATGRRPASVEWQEPRYSDEGERAASSSSSS